MANTTSALSIASHRAHGRKNGQAIASKVDYYDATFTFATLTFGSEAP